MTDQSPQRSSVYTNPSFLGMVATQFLGAFNDNVFKQTVMLVLAVSAMGNQEDDLQGQATVIFSAPFILLSGFCGYLGDRHSKRTIVVLSKVLEIVVMGLGMLAFLSGSAAAMLIVLGLMGSQSALFGPAKYGILPELFPDRDLPRVNGVILMTTFLSIILGFTAAGFLAGQIEGKLWIASVACIGIAVLGTLTALMIRRTPVAHPHMPFDKSVLLISRETRQVLRSDRKLLAALLASSMFWMAGGMVYPPAINKLGIDQFEFDEAQTGMMAASTGIGIAIGCLIAGGLSRNRFHGSLVFGGCLGMFVSLILLGIPTSAKHHSLLGPAGSSVMLIILGISAGLFTVPLQAYLQARTPREHKGRVIGAMNLLNWIGIASAGGVYIVVNLLFAQWNKAFPEWTIPPSAMFLAAACVLLPLLVLYHPKSEDFSDVAPASARNPD